MSDIHAWIGAYVTDAVDADTRAAFEAHMAECPTCRREVAEFAETLGELSVLSATRPPPALRDNVLQAVQSTRPLPPHTRTPDHEEAHLAEPASAATHDAGPTAVPLRPRRTRRLGWIVAAAALVAAVVLGGWVVQLQQLQRTQQQAATAMIELSSAPDLQRHRVALGAGEGAYLVSRDQDRGTFVASGVPAPGADRTYQLWLIRDGVPASAGLAPNGGQMRMWFSGVRNTDAVAITVEPMGGSRAPTTELMAAATF